MTFSEFLNFLTWPFAVRALVVGAAVSLCASALGVVLVLKRYALIGHGLSEVGFASLSAAAALGWPPLLVSGPLVLLASFAIMFVSQRRRVGGDIAIAVASSAALALGVIVTSLSGGTNAVYGYMFGSVLTLTREDAFLSVGLSLVVLVLFALFFNRLFLVTCNEDYARSLGVRVWVWQFLISVMTALTVVLGMRMMGTLLISSLIILPAVTARHAAGSFRGLVILSALTSLVCFVAGMALSFVWNLPAGAGVVLVNVAAMLCAGLVRRFLI